jgi:EAL and modified HD-GYP domain-containing signal transduction protein
LSRILEADVSLSYRLLRYINSPFFGLAKKVTSILHAINLLGERQIRHWLRILLMADLNPSDRGQEMVRLCAMRGRFLHSMAQRYAVGFSAETMFMIGLFSALDTILDQPMETILKELPLTKEVSLTLLGEQTAAAPWLDMVKALQRADWKTVRQRTDSLGVVVEDAAHLFNEASRWSMALLRQTRAEEN